MELTQLIEWRGKPDKIRVDNGPEFIAFALGEWCERNQIELKLNLLVVKATNRANHLITPVIYFSSSC